MIYVVYLLVRGGFYSQPRSDSDTAFMHAFTATQRLAWGVDHNQPSSIKAQGGMSESSRCSLCIVRSDQHVTACKVCLHASMHSEWQMLFVCLDTYTLCLLLHRC